MFRNSKSILSASPATNDCSLSYVLKTGVYETLDYR